MAALDAAFEEKAPLVGGHVAGANFRTLQINETV